MLKLILIAAFLICAVFALAPFMRWLTCLLKGHAWSYTAVDNRHCIRCDRKEKHVFFADHEIVGHWVRQK